MARIPFDPVMTSPTKRVPWFESLVPCLGLLAWLGASSLASSALAADPSDVTRRDPYRSCGLNCLAILAHLQNVHVPLGSIEEQLNPRDNGECSVADLERASRTIGLDPVGARLDWDQLPAVPLPCIVQLRSETRYATGSHYAILMGLHRTGVILLDAPSPSMLHPYEEFRRDFTGVVVAFPSEAEQKRAFLARVGEPPAWSGWAARVLMVVAIGALAWWVRPRRPSGEARRPDMDPVVEASPRSPDNERMEKTG